MAPESHSARRQLAVGGEVQVREEHLARAQQLDLGRLRLLDLQDQLRLGEHRLRVRHDAGALGHVRVVVDRAALAGAGLDQHLVAVLRQLARAGRRQRDAVLVRLDLGGDADPHAADCRSGRPDLELAVAARSSSGNRSSGSMQRSGGSAPRASIRPRASSRTAAAAGAPVETTPPPSPQRLDRRR